MLGAAPTSSAAAIPVWLDDAISDWNDEDPAVQIKFVDIKELSNTKMADDRCRGAGQRQRMLTTLVCEDGDYWFAGFRVLQ